MHSPGNLFHAILPCGLVRSAPRSATFWQRRWPRRWPCSKNRAAMTTLSETPTSSSCAGCDPALVPCSSGLASPPRLKFCLRATSPNMRRCCCTRCILPAAMLFMSIFVQTRRIKRPTPPAHIQSWCAARFYPCPRFTLQPAPASLSLPRSKGRSRLKADRAHGRACPISRVSIHGLAVRPRYKLLCVPLRSAAACCTACLQSGLALMSAPNTATGCFI